ncbi:uncharacterized protein LOC112683834 [Sipha flava]|uniref:Uncharacterized protein LOC112683834 n=1 Tax=Sipha flava TaxID=143950 RepID=A0A8B8FJL6_9HEMI|nr:uncharacterized protein LOC112683834 [Sipha flava]
MWKTLQNICIQITGNIINLSNFHVNFEKSVHNAVLQIFPYCKITCCNFHLGQNWFRHIQQHKLLSSEYLNNDSEVGKWMKCFFGISYLPPDEVSDGFCDLMSIAPSTTSKNISIFFDYILENYIASDSNFPPTLWACKPTNNPKTTNGAESYYKQFNSQFYTAHLHIHQVIDVIIEIQNNEEMSILLKHRGFLDFPNISCFLIFPAIPSQMNSVKRSFHFFPLVHGSLLRTSNMCFDEEPSSEDTSVRDLDLVVLFYIRLNPLAIVAGVF